MTPTSRCGVCLDALQWLSYRKGWGCPKHLDWRGEDIEPCKPHGREHLAPIYRPGRGLHYGCSMCYRTST